MKVFLLILIVCLTVIAGPTSVRQDSAGISEVTLEMAQGEIDIDRPVGRAFVIILRRDGTASYEGKANVKLIGKFSGQISEEAFDKLASFLISRNYSQIREVLPHRMSPPAGTGILSAYAGSPVVTTSITRDGKKKMIYRFTSASSGELSTVPKEIIEIEKAIIDAAMKISWQKVR